MISVADMYSCKSICLNVYPGKQGHKNSVSLLILMKMCGIQNQTSSAFQSISVLVADGKNVKGCSEPNQILGFKSSRTDAPKRGGKAKEYFFSSDQSNSSD